MKHFPLVCLVSTILAVGLSGRPAGAQDTTPSLDHYRVLPRLSTVHQTGGFAGYDWRFRLLGKYDYGDGRSEQDPNYMIFSQRNCNYPHQIYATWWLTQLRSWNMTKGAPDYNGIARRVLRPDYYLEAMKELGVKVTVAEEQQVTLFDGVFDGKDPEKYARSFAVRAI